MIVIDPRAYLGLHWIEGGRERPAVDCWGLYRLIVAEVTGLRLGEHGAVAGSVAVARRLAAEREQAEWTEVAPGDDRPLDLVLMSGLLRGPAGLHAAPLHVGCVLEAGTMIDIERETGVMVRAYRDTPRRPALPTAARRLLGVYRNATVAEVMP